MNYPSPAEAERRKHAREELISLREREDRLRRERAQEVAASEPVREGGKE